MTQVVAAIDRPALLEHAGKLLPVIGPAAAVEVGLMLVLGFGAGRLLGWTPRDALFLGGTVAISSTMIVAKAFEDRRPSRRPEDLVLGVLVMEDLVAILLIVFYTAEAVGTGVGPGALAGAVVRLLGFLVLMLAVGMLLVPRAMRLVTRLGKDETILVSAVGLAFLFALLASLAATRSLSEGSSRARWFASRGYSVRIHSPALIMWRHQGGISTTRVGKR